MEAKSHLQIDPGCLDAASDGSELEIVVPYSEPSITAATLRRAAVLTAGLNARVSLLAVHTLPYPAPFVCPALAHAHLVEQLTELAAESELAVQPQVVLARDRVEGFRFALEPASTVLVGSRKSMLRTQEEKLARSLAGAGHKVVLVHIT
jgi:hypothetical protein